MKLTPLGKALCALIIVGGAGSVVWNTGARHWVQQKVKPEANTAGGSATAATTSTSLISSAMASTGFAKAAPLGSAAHPLKVSIVSFHGYAPALVANGNSLTTQPGSLYD